MPTTVAILKVAGWPGTHDAPPITVPPLTLPGP